MKLLELKIEGYRSLRNVVWKPGDLNVLIGPNAGGKSNLLKALHMLAASASADLSRHLIRREGGIGAVVWDGQATSINFSLLMCRRDTEAQRFGRYLRYGLLIDRVGKTSSYKIREEQLSADASETSSSGANLILDRSGPHVVLYDPFGDPVRLYEADGSRDDESALKLVSHPSLPDTPARDVCQELIDWAVHYDFRTDSRAAIREPPIARTEFVPDSAGDNLTNVLHTLYTNNREFESSVDDAMSAAFGKEFVKLVFSPDAGDQRVQLRVRWKHLQHDRSQADLSDGTLRFLYLLAILSNPKPPPLIAIDEPEAGLHPSMLGVVAEIAAEAAGRAQVVFTTHSADLLDSLTQFKPTTHVVESHAGETRIKTLSGEKLEYWLKGYTLGELYRSTELETLV